MEKEKMEKQKIEEKDLGNVAGGFDFKLNYSNPNDTTPPKNIGTFFVDDEELKLLKKSGILNADGNLYEENLPAASLILGFQPDSETGKKRGKNEIIVE